MERVVKRGQGLKSFGVLKSRVTIEKNPMHLLKKTFTSIATLRLGDGCAIEGLSAGTIPDMFPLSYILG